MIIQSNDLHQVLSGQFAESEPKEFSGPVDEGEQAENYGYYSDSDLEDDDEDAVNAAGRASKGAIRPRRNLHPTRSTADQKEPVPTHGEWEELLAKGTVIKIRDIAFITCVPLMRIAMLLIVLQIPGLFTVSIHRQYRVRTLWIGGESEVKECRNNFFFR